MPLSNVTYARLSEAMPVAFSHAQIEALFFEFGVQDRDPGSGLGTNKTKRSLALIRAILDLRTEESDSILLNVANRVLSNPYNRPQLSGLTAALAADGYEWGNDRLVASDPDVAPLAPETTALEQELKQLGLNVAASHYRQAVDNYTNGNYEASNGQLRSFFEDTITGAARRRGQSQESGPDAALDYLRNNGVIDGQEFGMFRSLWHGTQDNGPHAALTDYEEARFRMYALTAAGRYLVKKVA